MYTDRIVQRNPKPIRGLAPVWWVPDFLAVWLGRKVIFVFMSEVELLVGCLNKDAVALYEDNVDLSLASAA